MSYSANSDRSVVRLRRLKMAGIALLALISVGLSMTYFFLSVNRPFMGISLALNQQGWSVDSVDANGQAARAGITVGSTPVAINDQPAAVFLAEYTDAGVVIGPLMQDLTVLSPSGRMLSATIRGAAPTVQSVTEVIVFFIVVLAFWMVGLFAFFKKPDKLAAVLLCHCALFLGLALSANLAAQRAIFASMQIHILTSTFGPWLLAHFVLVLPEERTWARTHPLVYIIYLLPLIITILQPIIGFTEDQPVAWFRTLRLIVSGAGLATAVALVIYNFARARSYRTREQMKVVLFSCLAALCPFLLLYILPVALFGDSFIPSVYYMLFIVLIPLGMGYAVVTQKLMDINFVIRRTVVYGLITVAMSTILSGAIVLIAALGTPTGKPIVILEALGLGGVSVVLFDPVKHGIEFVVDKYFYKDRYDYRQIIQRFGASLSSLQGLTDISRLIVGTIVRTLNLSGACLFIRLPNNALQLGAAQGIYIDTTMQKRLQHLIALRSGLTEFPNPASILDPSVAYLIPLAAGNLEVGVLCLSPKASQQDFSNDDRYLLQGMAPVAAVALRSASLMRDVDVRNTFISIASHEISTPLTSIKGFTELLLNSETSPEKRTQWLQKISDNANRINMMVEDLLNVTKIQSGRVSVKAEPFDVSALIYEQIILVRETTGKHEFVVNISPVPPNVFADRDKLGQVIMNLLSNAVKYSPNGGRITISADPDQRAGKVVISVADQGIGISKEDQESLFNTFHRIQRPETQNIRGSGLGLYIVKEWIERMGGEVWLESELNRGSTFFISVPVPDNRGLKSV